MAAWSATWIFAGTWIWQSRFERLLFKTEWRTFRRAPGSLLILILKRKPRNA